MSIKTLTQSAELHKGPRRCGRTGRTGRSTRTNEKTWTTAESNERRELSQRNLSNSTCFNIECVHSFMWFNANTSRWMNKSQHLISQCVLLGGRCDAKQPEDGDTDGGHRTRHRVQPQQVSAVYREARHEHRRYHSRHEHRGGDDGVSGRHCSDFMVPHYANRPYLQQNKR